MGVSQSATPRLDAFGETFDFLLRHATVAAGALFVTLFAYTAFSRAAFPFDLEWIEGAMVDQVDRLVRGEPMYVAPSVEFVPLVYAPGYFYVSAVAASVLGVSLTTLRLVSIACTFGLFAMLVAFGRRERGSLVDGLVVAGVFAAMYVVGGAWLDLARVDALFLLLTLASTYYLRFGESAGEMATAGLLLAGALLTKQTVLTIAPPLLLYALLRVGRRALVAIAAFGAATAVTVVVLNWLSEGWFLYYTFETLTKTQNVWNGRLLDFWTMDLLKSVPIATALAAGWCVFVWRTGRFEDWTFYALAAVALVASTWQVRLHPGAWLNTLLPAYLFIALASTRAAASLNRRVAGAGSILLLIQFALLAYHPAAYIPSNADHLAAERLLDTIRRVPGDVLMVSHGHLPAVAGKRTFAHEMAIRDVLTTRDEWAARLRADIRHALEVERFDAILQDTVNWFPVPLGRYYGMTGHVFDSIGTLATKAGAQGRPEYIYQPRGRWVERPRER